MAKNKLKSTTQEHATFKEGSGSAVKLPRVPSVSNRHTLPHKRQQFGSDIPAKDEIRRPRKEAAQKQTTPRDTELSRLQKNARNKEYRLRQLGASNEAVDFASPRISMVEVKKMNPQQKAEYKAQLKAFNSRENKLSTAAYNGTIKSINAWAGEYNKHARSERQRIESIPVDYSVSGAAGAIKPISQWKAERGLAEKDPRTGQPTGRVFVTRGQIHGSVSELGTHTMQKPKDLKTALKREETVRKMAQMKFSERRKSLRKSVDEMVRAYGDDDLADRIAKLSAAQFDILMHETNFMAEVAVAYSPFSERKTSGMSELRAIAKGGEGNGDGTADFEGQKSAASELVSIVEGAVR